MELKKEQRYAILYCVRRGLSGSETVKELKEASLAMRIGRRARLRKPETRLDKKTVRQAMSAGKVILMAFFDDCIIVYQYFVLREPISRKQPDKKTSWILYHHNAHPHTSNMTQYFLAKHKITVLPHPPYSSFDLAPCDFWIFQILKKEIRGRKFINIPEEEFRRTIHIKWAERMHQCIHSYSRYFKKCLEPSNHSDFEGDATLALVSKFVLEINELVKPVG